MDSNRQAPQDETGRLWDVLVMTRFAIRRSRGSGDRITVELYRIPRGGKARQPCRARLAACIGPGDHAWPVLTISPPGED
ncbi:hypothetical protein SRB17_85240 [Streptomyces sp. RB17]|nr:hypothetical protein [Streptomyces sp. RB17]